MSSGKPRLRVRWRALVRLSIRRGIPVVEMPSGLKSFVSWLLRALTTLGVIGSLWTFPNRYFALAFALVLLGIEQFFERVVFKAAVIYVQPVPPDFKYDPNEWVGMGYAFPKDTKQLNVVGPAFRSTAYAKRFFEVLLYRFSER